VGRHSMLYAKDNNLTKHPFFNIPYLQVIQLMQSFVS